MMYPYNEDIQNELDALCKITSSDFSGLAWMDDQDSRIRWLYASGNSNERFKSLALKPGYGLAGLVLKLGRSVIIDLSTEVLERNRLQHDYSIMLIEHLQSAIALPITIHDEARGVLLIGNRTDRYYEENDLHIILNANRQFEYLLQSDVKIDNSMALTLT
ncbi:MAG: GAF domain-containing protein [Paenibacillaceae bacterium]